VRLVEGLVHEGLMTFPGGAEVRLMPAKVPTRSGNIGLLGWSRP